MTARGGGHAGRRAGSQAGFTLLEMVCALAIVAALAAIALPRLPFGTTRARLEAYAMQAAALLKADRGAAVREGVMAATEVDVGARRIRSGATGRMVRLPEDVRLEAMLPRFCGRRAVRGRIDFFPSGMSCGGVLVLSHRGVAYEVRVNWLTGGVEIVPHRAA